MREKPILFNTEMVQAILDGRKTQTRRIVKPEIVNRFDICPIDGSIAYIDQATGDSYKPTDVCTYQLGDILWVRETWAFIDNLTAGVGDDQYYEYKADTNNPLPGDWPLEEKGGTCLRWKPSIHMPREAARIFLKVTDVRVERLQEITEEDARAEGVKAYGPNNCSGTSARIAFAELWDAMYEKQGYGWETNPWVWVIEFKRIKGGLNNEI